jgi:hypothetical protein
MADQPSEPQSTGQQFGTVRTETRIRRALGDFNNDEAKVTVSELAGTEFKNGNFSMPYKLLNAAKALAQGMLEHAKSKNADLGASPEWQAVKGLTTNGEITQDSLASYLLARSMGSNTVGNIASELGNPANNRLTATFDNKLSPEDYDPAKADPKLVFEMARQIMGDNGMQNVIGGATDTPEGNATINAMAGKATQTFVGKC